MRGIQIKISSMPLTQTGQYRYLQLLSKWEDNTRFMPAACVPI